MPSNRACVVYFDQRTVVSALKQVFCLFPSLMEEKERKNKRDTVNYGVIAVEILDLNCLN